MKKENRRLAQEKRAQERKRLAQQKKIKKFLSYFIPSLCIVLLAAVLIWDSVKNSEKEENSQTEEAQTTEQEDDTKDEASEDSSPSYSTDSSLTVADGDKINIDYVGSIDGVEFDGGNTNGAGADLVIGSGSYIDDFEEQLIGTHPGDSTEVQVTFPEDYGKDELNGKEAVFQVTVNGIYQEE